MTSNFFLSRPFIRGLLILFCAAVWLLPSGAWANCGPRNALGFSGGHVVVSNLPAFGNNFSVEAWVYVTGSGQRTVLSRGGGSDANSRSDFILAFSGTGQVVVFARGEWIPTAAVRTDTWMHLAVVVYGKRKALYIDGVRHFDFEGHEPASLPSDEPLYIGRQGRVCNCNFFSGAIDEVRIWSVALTPEQIATRYRTPLTGVEPGLVGYYLFDEAGGNVLLDDAGGDHPGFLTGGIARQASGAPLLALAPSATLEVSSPYRGGALLRGAITANYCPTYAYFEWDSLGQTQQSAPFFFDRFATNAPIEVYLPEVLPGTYHARLIVGNDMGTTISPVTFEVDSSVPILTVETAAQQGFKSVDVTGLVTSAGWTTGAWFEWGLDGALDQRTAAVILPRETEDGPIAATLTNLAEGTYTVRLVGTNGLGTNYSAPVAFTVVWTPLVSLEITASLTAARPLLEARVTAGGYPTAAWLEWGQGGDFSNRTTPVEQTALEMDRAITNVLTGLAAGQWNARIVASNRAGTVSASGSFTLGPFEFIPTSIPIGGKRTVPPRVVWGDVQRDGRLDLAVMGGTSQTSELWTNSPAGFSQLPVGWSVLEHGGFAWGDLDNDGDLDAVLSGGVVGSPTIQRAEAWLNEGAFFTLAQTNLTPSINGDVKIADFDNDGHSDVLVAGTRPPAAVENRINLWKNSGTPLFTEAPASFPGMPATQIEWADYNGDGWPDLAFGGGVTPNGRVFELWPNQGGVFSKLGLISDRFEAFAWGDVNNDGRLDLVTAMRATNFVPEASTILWTNTGVSFLPNRIGPTNQSTDQITLGDYDNDGRLDIAFVVRTVQGVFTTLLWRNTGNGFESVDFTSSPPTGSAVSWGDYDNDGRLDFAAAGSNTFGVQTVGLYHNRLPGTNAPPSAPRGLAITLQSDATRLSWLAATDDHTPSSGLSYNLRVGTTPGGIDIVSPLADVVTGRRHVAARGNADLRDFSLLTGLQPGVTYYWSVQAIDTSFAGGAWALEQTFEIEAALGFTRIEARPDGGTFLRLRTPFATTIIETSSNLTDWTPWRTIVTNTVPAVFEFLDTPAGNPPQRFYRARSD